MPTRHSNSFDEKDTAWLIPPATRDGAVAWDALVSDALSLFGLSPSAEAMGALHAISSYAASTPHVLRGDAAALQRDAAAYSGLLLALHRATARWPAEARRVMSPPPVSIGAASVPVGSAAMERFVVLFNASACGLASGLSALARARSAGGAVGSKAAFRHFTAAALLAERAARLLEADGASLLAATERCDAARHFPALAAREFAELAAAVAKYAYSTTSEATARRQDTLARLALAAAAAPLPSAGPLAESLALLPTLLRVAAHRHRAEHCHRLEPVPDMDLVLGHTAHARRLLLEVYKHARARAAGGGGGQKDHTEAARRSGGWGILGRLSATLSLGGGTPSNAEETAVEDLTYEECADRLAQLPGLLEGTDVARVFPLVTSLVPEIIALSERYDRENDLIYHERPASRERVLADLPDVAEPSMSQGGMGNAPTPNTAAAADSAEEAERVVAETSIDAAALATLPTADELHARLRHTTTTRESAAQLRAAAARLETLEAQFPPPDVRLASEELRVAMRAFGASFPAAATTAESLVDASIANHADAADALRQAKSEYIGNHVGPQGDAVALKRRVDDWRRAKAALPMHLLSEVDVLALGGQTGAAIRRARQRATTALSSAADVDLPHDESLSDLEAARQMVAVALQEGRDACDAAAAEGKWERLAVAMRDAAHVLEEAAAITAVADKEAKRVQSEQGRIVVTPLRRLGEVAFESTDPPNARQQRGKGRGRNSPTPKPSKHLVRTPTPPPVQSSDSESESSSEGEACKVMRCEERTTNVSEATVAKSLLQRIRANRMREDSGSDTRSEKTKRRRGNTKNRSDDEDDESDEHVTNKIGRKRAAPRRRESR